MHKARVGTRRLRSDLATLAPLLDEEWATALRSELKWLAVLLGGVRDTDVLLARLWAVGRPARPSRTARRGPASSSGWSTSDGRRLAELLEAMGTDRYVDLLERVVEAAHHPRVERKAAKAAASVPP